MIAKRAGAISPGMGSDETAPLPFPFPPGESTPVEKGAGSDLRFEF